MKQWHIAAACSVMGIVGALALYRPATPLRVEASLPPALVQAQPQPLPQTCPYIDGRASVDNDKKKRKKARIAALTGEGLANHKTVFGVTLGQSNRQALDVWAAARGMTCMARHGSHDIECKAPTPSVVAAHLAAADDLTVYAAFGQNKRLSQLRFVASFSDTGKAAEAIRHTWKETADYAGAPSHVHGEPEAHFLSTSLWQQAGAEFRRQDLYAKVSATNLGTYVAFLHHVEDLSSESL